MYIQVWKDDSHSHLNVLQGFPNHGEWGRVHLIHALNHARIRVLHEDTLKLCTGPIKIITYHNTSKPEP